MELNQRNMIYTQSQSSTLYKYHDIEGAKNMLSCRNLQFTNTTKLNAPFDCHPSLINFSNVPPEQCKSWPKEVIELVESDRHNIPGKCLDMFIQSIRFIIDVELLQ